MYILDIQVYTSIYQDIHGIYHEHQSILNVSLADHDAIVYEWYKSLGGKGGISKYIAWCACYIHNLFPANLFFSLLAAG